LTILLGLQHGAFSSLQRVCMRCWRWGWVFRVNCCRLRPDSMQHFAFPGKDANNMAMPIHGRDSFWRQSAGISLLDLSARLQQKDYHSPTSNSCSSMEWSISSVIGHGERDHVIVILGKLLSCFNSPCRSHNKQGTPSKMINSKDISIILHELVKTCNSTGNMGWSHSLCICNR